MTGEVATALIEHLRRTATILSGPGELCFGVIRQGARDLVPKSIKAENPSDRYVARYTEHRRQDALRFMTRPERLVDYAEPIGLDPHWVAAQTKRALAFEQGRTIEEGS